ncbi:MAG: GerW family sporulation protein [Armatimonadota bacterium]
MSEFDVSAFMKDVVGGLMTVTESVKIIGEPVTVGDKVVIPAVVAKVAFGAGGGSGKNADRPGDASQQGSGGGGGGGVIMTPVFLIVDSEGERLLTVPGPFDAASSMFEKAKGALDRFMPRKRGGKDLADDPELRDLEEGASAPAH